MASAGVAAIPRRDPTSARIAVAIAATAVYAVLSCCAIAESWSHYELIVIGLRYLLLFPAFVYALRQSRASAAIPAPASRFARLVIAAFLVVASFVSWSLRGGFVVPDESSYRFQARIIAAGRLMAPAPPGAPERQRDMPVPLQFTHQVLSPNGWYSKYPIAWPAVLAIPERVHLGWLVNPLLGALLLALIGWIAREVFGDSAVVPAVTMGALSAYLLGNSVGRMSHGLSSVLVAGATLLCLQGLKTGRISRFSGMFALLAATFHVRPFTAFVVSVVLGLGSLIGVTAVGSENRRALRSHVAALGATAAILAITSVLLYNWRFTGHPLLSPYAVVQSTKVPPELTFTAAELFRNFRPFRFALQSTLVYTVPFLAPLVLYKMRATRRKEPAKWLLLTLPFALAAAHFGASGGGSASVIGERFWVEGYFAVVVLAAGSFVRLIGDWQSDRRVLRASVIALAAAQVAIMAAGTSKLMAASRPAREMRRLAETYSACNCVVFFGSNPPAFWGIHLNLNGPHWPAAKVFYAVDPGAEEREKWTARLGKPRWVVLNYDSQAQRARVESSASP